MFSLEGTGQSVLFLTTECKPIIISIKTRNNHLCASLAGKWPWLPRSVQEQTCSCLLVGFRVDLALPPTGSSFQGKKTLKYTRQIRFFPVLQFKNRRAGNLWEHQSSLLIFRKLWAEKWYMTRGAMNQWQTRNYSFCLPSMSSALYTFTSCLSLSVSVNFSHLVSHFEVTHLLMWIPDYGLVVAGFWYVVSSTR